MKFDVDVIMNALEVMWKGMLSIFVVIFILALIIVILTKVTNMKIFKKAGEDTAEE